MRRVISVVVLCALLAFYAATWFVDAESSARTTTVTDSHDWTGVQLGFDEDGTPTIRMSDGEASALEAACNREAERYVPAGAVLKAATSIPAQKERLRVAVRTYLVYVRGHSEHPITAAVRARKAQLMRAVRLANARHAAAGEKYERLARQREDVFSACMSRTA